MNKLNNKKYFNYALKSVERLFEKNKKTSEEEASHTIINIEEMNIPFNVKCELVSKLYKELEN